MIVVSLLVGYFQQYHANVCLDNFRSTTKWFGIPIVLRVLDQKLGEIGKYELPFEAVRYYRRWCSTTPIIHWTFVPKSSEISRLLAEGSHLKIDQRPCDVEFVVTVNQRKIIRPKICRPECFSPYADVILFDPPPKPLPVTRVSRWHVQENSLEV